MLNIICISKGSVGLDLTLDSFEAQADKNAKIIFVFRDVQKSFIDRAELIGKLYNSFEIIRDQCSSLSNACNIGLNYCAPGHVWFVDAGDMMANENSIQIINSYIRDTMVCLAFDCFLLWRNEKYLRSVTKGKRPNIGHVGFIGIVDEIRFDERASYSADYTWILDQIRKYGYSYQPDVIVGAFALGGISTFPKFKNVIQAFKVEKYRTKLKYLLRFCLFKLLGETGYLKFMMKYKGYKAVHDDSS